MRSSLFSLRKELWVLFKIAIPLALAQMGQNNLALADTVMVGKLGPEALAACSFASSIFIVFMMFGQGALSPMTALFSKAVGENRLESAGPLLKKTLQMGFLLTVLISILLASLTPFLNIFSQPKEVTALAQSYFLLITGSLLPILLFQAYKQFTDGIGHVWVSVVIMYLGLGINIYFNALWIPDYGLDGAGYATVLTRFLMLFLLMAWIHLHPQYKKYLAKKQPLFSENESVVAPNQEPSFSALLRLGLPMGFTLVFEVAAFSFCTVMMGWFGTLPLAAHQVALSLAATSFLFTVGIGIAASIRIGFERGRQNYPHLRFAGWVAIGSGFIYMSICAVIFLLARFHLPAFFTADKDTILLAGSFLLVVAAFEMFDGIQAVAIGALRGLSDTQVPSLLAFIAYWVLGIPMGYFLAFHAALGPVGIWLGLLIGLIGISILLAWRFHRLSSALLKS